MEQAETDQVRARDHAGDPVIVIEDRDARDASRVHRAGDHLEVALQACDLHLGGHVLRDRVLEDVEVGHDIGRCIARATLALARCASLACGELCARKTRAVHSCPRAAWSFAPSQHRGTSAADPTFMPSPHLASDEPVLADALLVVAIAGGVLEVICGAWLVIEQLGLC